MSQVRIERADMKRDESNQFVGYTVFSIDRHAASYEITFLSKNGRDWDYSLNFAGEPGIEEQFMQLDERIETDDELFDDLLDAAIDASEFGE
ncbi:hypothetical protein AWU65_21785 [Paenibacillus glucanolyticus]|uniref:Uncharacterized protein n=1 Tax=Paenibacillus glucanolyticus TaxID=59843 RepID=A0A163LR21_9BACL|nr:hypothetical protein [Paenibacillus glucanolyticus]KZS48374.1 hypothetical protein AWU65_21785 [Paenibacillus glucanolyticus]